MQTHICEGLNRRRRGLGLWRGSNINIEPQANLFYLVGVHGKNAVGGLPERENGIGEGVGERGNKPAEAINGGVILVGDGGVGELGEVSG